MAQVVPLYNEINALNTNVVAVSFGTAFWARAWLTETQAPFPILLDPEKKSYRVYGLERSAWKAWGPKNLWYYAKALAQGEKLQEKRGDTDQMGGDFIVDANGIVQFAYPSKDPTDRPHMESVMTILQNLN